MYTPSNGFGYYHYVPPVPPQEAEKKKLRSTALRVGTMLLVLIGTMQIVYTVVVLALMVAGILPEDALTADMLGVDNRTFLLIYSAVYALSMGLPMLVVMIGKNRIFPLSPAKSMRGSTAFLGILGGVGVCMAANIVTSYILAFLEQFGVTVPETPQMMVNTPESYLLNLFTIAVLPALLEEMVFRGCVLRLFRSYGDGFAIIVSATTFSLMHGNIRQIPFAFIVGLVLGWLYVVTNNIWIPIMVHFINNGVSVSMEYLGFFLPEETVGVFYTLIIIALAIIGLGAGLVFILTNLRNIRFAPKTTTLTIGERFGVLLKAPTFLIAIILYILLTLMGM